MTTISLRQARIVLAVARGSSVTGAARAINRSQTSVTKSMANRGKSIEECLELAALRLQEKKNGK